MEGNEARRYISTSDSSTSTWLGYNSPLPFSIAARPAEPTAARRVASNVACLHSTGVKMGDPINQSDALRLGGPERLRSGVHFPLQLQERFTLFDALRTFGFEGFDEGCHSRQTGGKHF